MSDYEFSDQDDYYDEDEEMDVQDEGTSQSEDDDDMMNDDDAFGGDDFRIPSPKGKRKPWDIQYDSLSVTAIEETIQKEADHIMSILGVDSSTAMLLLRYMKWNKERLIEKYMDTPDALNQAAGVSTRPPPSTRLSPAPVRSPPSTRPSVRRVTRSTKLEQAPPREVSEEPFVCPICCTEEPSKTSSLECGHTFCSDCWSMYVTSKIREEGECSFTCMSTDCSLAVPDSFIDEATDEGTFQRFRELVVRHYLAHQPQLKYCPAPSCVYAVKTQTNVSKASLPKVVPIVRCSDNHAFCFGCTIDSDHRPLVCPVARLWMKKCQDDSETANWIKSNTKECSKCQSTIEKNGGCNHMTCKKCKHEFCWVCMGPWVEHGTAWYSCNRYDEKAGVDARDAQSKSRASLERYLHYYNRWANHEQSAKLSKELYTKTEKKMEEMQVTSDLTWIEVQFARKAVDEVYRCRMTLKWTYAMAYYLDRGNEKELFEDNQRDLEKAVEDLSELLEEPIDPEKIAELRQKMTDKTVYVQKRNEILLEDTAQGFLDGRWKWNVTVEGFGDEEDEDAYE
ncbi:hypothetical protein M422DRAFT_59265 [Sphaerobolus stellatus SS14]|nr:hypothetical protein M422DRAFT_59265 [Sphaerobolus stellatus SS14]